MKTDATSCILASHLLEDIAIDLAVEGYKDIRAEMPASLYKRLLQITTSRHHPNWPDISSVIVAGIRFTALKDAPENSIAFYSGSFALLLRTNVLPG